MYYKILNLFKGVSDYFQKVTSNLSSANILLKSAEDTFKTMRSSDDEFLLIYFEAIKICENNNIDIPSANQAVQTSRVKKCRNDLNILLLVKI
jgi:hypothetical protein